MRSESTIPAHVCTLREHDRASESCLPRLPPNAPLWRRWCRSLRKLFLVSDASFDTHIYFRSHAAYIAERNRQIRQYGAFAIHPMSVFCAYREMTMVVVWTLLFVLKPVNWVMYDDLSEMALTKVVAALAVADMFPQFFIGYTDDRKQVVLERRAVALRYLKTYFVPDLLANVPAITGSAFLGVCGLIGVFGEYVRLVRLRCYLKYVDRATDFFKNRESVYEITCLCVVFFYLLHFSACTIYLAANVSKALWGNNERAWQETAGYTADTGFFYKYSECVLEAASLLYTAGVGYYPSDAFGQSVKTVVLLLGGLFLSYTLVKVFEIISVSQADKIKYTDVTEELSQFMVGKKLPRDLREKILAFYEYSFDKRYFSERAIMSTLSEHLKYEIKLHSCKNIITKVEMFEGLPKTVLAGLIAAVDEEVVLANEVIYRAGDRTDGMYMIAEGTVAVFSARGGELFHLKDQQSFGELAVILKRFRAVSVVAVETTRLYVLSADELQRVLQPHPEVHGRLVDRAHARLLLLKERRGRLVENRDLVDVLEDAD